MKLLALLSLAALAVSASPTPANSNAANSHGNGNGHNCGASLNELYQYSTIGAVTKGVADSGPLLSDVLSRGTLGLGTFLSLSGEMIILDGVAYRATSNGTIERPNPRTTRTPFVAITAFDPAATTRVPIASYADFSANLQSWFGPAPLSNHFVAYRVDGTFTLRVRAPAGQLYPLEPLANVVARQTVFDYTALKGTLVGFRTPAYAGALNAAGDHLHFISQDRTKGGHVLAFATVGDAVVKMARVDRYELGLPVGGQFDEVSLP